MTKDYKSVTITLGLKDNYIIARSGGVYLQIKERRNLRLTNRPPKEYTNQQWQSDFELIKQSVIPVQESKMRVIGDTSLYGSYHGKTQYQNYCSFINNILNNIRHKEIDYCFYIYQILDLLKYEKGRLEVQWLQSERCFRVSLE